MKLEGLQHAVVINPPEIEEHFSISVWFKMNSQEPSTLRGLFSWGSDQGVNYEAHGLFATEYVQVTMITN